MRLGLSSYACAWEIGVGARRPKQPLDAGGLVRRAGELGAEVVQIADNLPLGHLGASEIEQLGGDARRANLEIELATRGTEPGVLDRHLELSRALGCRLVRTVLDGDGESDIDEIAKRLSPLRERFLAAGVRLAIENHDGIGARRLRRLIERLGVDWTGVCLDTVNSFGALEGPEVVIDTLAPITVNLHVKDFAISRAAHAMSFVIEGRPAGRGRLDVPSLLARLSGVEPQITAALELWVAPQATLEATIATERLWAAQSMAFLRDAVARVNAERA